MKMVDQREVLTIAEVNSLAKEVLESLNFWVEGEIYDFKSANQRYYYVYFQLKDDDGRTVLPAIMYPKILETLNFNFDNGQKVLAHGKLTLLTRSGKYQFLVDAMELAGEGQLAKQLEALKAKLQSEGLFDELRKRPLPPYPQKVGVITSIDSDAWADFQRHSIAKFPLIELTVADAYVQGSRAVTSLLRAIERMQSQPIEVLVITRGGGSLEDLAAFSDESVVRAIADSKIPTLVGVGHEKDISIADLVADVRASTPTNAGQILTQHYQDAVIELTQVRSKIQHRSHQLLEDLYGLLDDLAAGLQRTRHTYQTLPWQLQHLGSRLEQARQSCISQQLTHLDQLMVRLQLPARRLVPKGQDKLEATYRQLQAVSPESVLARGYSIVEANDKVVRSWKDAKQGDTMRIRLSRGSLRGLVTRSEEH